MKQFAALYKCLDETTKTNRKIECLCDYLRSAPAADAAWAVYFLSGRKPKRLVKSADLRTWAAEQAGIADWLFEECHETVGDLAETIALLLPDPSERNAAPLEHWVRDRLLPLAGASPYVQRRRLVDAWQQLDRTERLVWNKLITGEFRVGVSQSLVVRAVAEVAGVPKAAIAHRLMGSWELLREVPVRYRHPSAICLATYRPRLSSF